MTTDLKKGEAIVQKFVYCTHKNSQLFRNVLYFKYSVRKIK